MCYSFVLGYLYVSDIIGQGEQRKRGVGDYKILKGTSAGLILKFRKKPSVSEFINIAFHMNMISLAGSHLTNTHQYPIIIWDIQVFYY